MFTSSIVQNMLRASRFTLLEIGQHFNGLPLSMFEFRLDFLHNVHDHFVGGRHDLFHEQHIATQGFHTIASGQVVVFAMHHNMQNAVDNEVDFGSNGIARRIIMIRTNKSFGQQRNE